jgi:hypothetical protein
MIMYPAVIAVPTLPPHGKAWTLRHRCLSLNPQPQPHLKRNSTTNRTGVQQYMDLGSYIG